jgi:hypothetical protein
LMNGANGYLKKYPKKKSLLKKNQLPEELFNS